MIENLRQVVDSWQPQNRFFEAAVRAVVEAQGYSESDVARRLSTCLSWFRNEVRGVNGQELQGDKIVHLCAATVPGLVVESLVGGLATGAHNVVIPSRFEVVLPHFIGHVRSVDKALSEKIEVVRREPVSEFDWSQVSAVVIHGDDQTVDLVRSCCAKGTRIVAFGNRQGVAIVDLRERESSAGYMNTKFDALADDVMTFGAAGCMSPTEIILVCNPGDNGAMEYFHEEFEQRLASAWLRHVPGASERSREIAYKRRARLDQLWLSGRSSSVASTHGYRNRILVEDVNVELVALTESENWDSLREHLTSMKDLLQTCVVVAPHPEAVSSFEKLAARAGSTRVCAPGDAHWPPSDWPHELVGRINPLLRVKADPN